MGGFGIHYPYPDCNLLDKRDLDGHFKGFGETNTIFHLDDPERYEREEGYRHYLAFSPTITPVSEEIFLKNIRMRMSTLPRIRSGRER